MTWNFYGWGLSVPRKNNSELLAGKDRRIPIMSTIFAKLRARWSKLSGNQRPLKSYLLLRST